MVRSIIAKSLTDGRCKCYAQWVAAGGVLMLMLQMGIMVGWTSPNISRLTSEESEIPITLSEASWVASCLNLGRFASVISLPFLLEYLGSKKTILFTLFPISVSWILMILVNNVEGLYAARTISGFSFGLAYGCFALYLGEVVVPTYRGTMISLAACGTQIGIVIGTTAETYLPMKISSAIYLIESVVAILLFIWLPESPYHLVKTDKMESARKSVAWYRKDSDIDKELGEIVKFVKSSSGHNFKDKLREFKSPAIMKALLLVNMLFVFLQLCGLFAIMFYMEVILINAKSFLVNPKEAVIYANLSSVASVCVGVRLIDNLGRKMLMLLSSCGITIAMLSLGTHFYLLDLNFDPNRLQWLPIASIVLFTITFSIGLMIVPSTVVSEIFPSNIKSVASIATTFTSALLGFLASKSYQPMVDAMGEAYVFWIYAAINVLAIPCVLFLMPETKGKTFQQIQDELLKR